MHFARQKLDPYLLPNEKVPESRGDKNRRKCPNLTTVSVLNPQREDGGDCASSSGRPSPGSAGCRFFSSRLFRGAEGSPARNAYLRTVLKKRLRRRLTRSIDWNIYLAIYLQCLYTVVNEELTCRLSRFWVRQPGSVHFIGLEGAMPRIIVPIERIFREVVKRDMTQAERGILLSKRKKAGSSKRRKKSRTAMARKKPRSM